MESISSRSYLKLTLALFLGLLLVVDVIADKKYSSPSNRFISRKVNDPEVVKLAQFAVDEHNKLAVPLSGVTHWQYSRVSKAAIKKTGSGSKKVVLSILVEDGPVGDICEAVVEVKRNVPKLLKFKEPTDV